MLVTHASLIATMIMDKKTEVHTVYLDETLIDLDHSELFSNIKKDKNVKSLLMFLIPRDDGQKPTKPAIYVAIYRPAFNINAVIPMDKLNVELEVDVKPCKKDLKTYHSALTKALSVGSVYAQDGAFTPIDVVKKKEMGDFAAAPLCRILIDSNNQIILADLNPHQTDLSKAEQNVISGRARQDAGYFVKAVIDGDNADHPRAYYGLCYGIISHMVHRQVGE